MYFSYSPNDEFSFNASSLICFSILCMELRYVMRLMNSVLMMPNVIVAIRVHDNDKIKIFDWMENLMTYSISSRSFNMLFSAITSCSDNEEDCASLQIAIPRDVFTCSHGCSAVKVFSALSFSFS